MRNTTNYNLKLPEGPDKYNIQDFNSNAEKIDAELKSHSDAIADRYNKTEVDNKFSMHEMNVDWKESVDTFDDISTTYPNPENGWTVNAKDTNYTYRFDGTAWVAISANAIPKATEDIDGLMEKAKVTEINKLNSEMEDVKQDLFPTYTLELEKDINIPDIKSNVVYGNGKYLALVENGYCVSKDGETWNTIEFAGFSNREFVVGFLGGKFVVGGMAEKTMYISETAELSDWHATDRIEWTIKKIKEVNKRYFLITNDGVLLEIVEWTNISTPTIRAHFGSRVTGITDITYGNGKYVISTTNGMRYSDDELLSLGEITNGEDEEFENSNFKSVLYADEQFIAVTQNGKTYRSKNAQNWEDGLSLNKTVTEWIEYLNGLFFIICGRHIYVTKDGKEAKSFISSLYDMTSMVNAGNKIAFYDIKSRVSYAYVENSLKEQVHELNSALGNTVIELNEIGQSKIMVGTDGSQQSISLAIQNCREISSVVDKMPFLFFGTNNGELILALIHLTFWDYKVSNALITNIVGNFTIEKNEWGFTINGLRGHGIYIISGPHGVLLTSNQQRIIPKKPV